MIAAIIAVLVIAGIFSLVIPALAAAAPYLLAATVVLLVAVIIVNVIASSFFKGEKFKAIKAGIAEYITDCNDLNAHIGDLRKSYVNVKKTDYGEASYSNVGKQNFKRKGIANAAYAQNVYDCSKQVCDGARKQPFKYICKYFNIQSDEKSLSQFEEILNNFIAAEDGKELSRKKRNGILDSIKTDIPWIIRKFFPDRLNRELGFDEFLFDELFFPTFSFRYISSGGNSGAQFDTTLDIPMLERFIDFLSEKVKFAKSAAGQRRLMTTKLRASIIDRDNRTCKMCGNSTGAEPNLLLEVDHIIPVSKGGMTTEDNLQTLCWKCNRSKGAKIL